MKAILSILIVALISGCATGDLSNSPNDMILEFKLVSPSKTKDSIEVKYDKETLWLQPNSSMTSAHIASAVVEIETPPPNDFINEIKKIAPNAKFDYPKEGVPKIYLKMTEKGKAILQQVTEDNIGRKLAVVCEGRVLMAPKIMQAINGGELSISGAFTKEEAEDIVNKINRKSN